VTDGTAETPPDRPPAWRIETSRTVALRDGRTVILRPVRTSDADLMAAFFASMTERETYYFFPLDEPEARRLAIDCEHDPAYRLLAVDAAGSSPRMVGYMFLLWRGPEPPTYGVCLLPDAQSSGLARTMLDHLLGSAARSGVERCRLTVHTDNWRALRLYQRCGFVLVDDFVNTHQGVKQYRMEADLRSERPRLTDDLAVVPRGGIGLAPPVTAVQRAVEAATRLRPLVLDRPARPGGRAVFVADLGPGVVGAPSSYPGLEWGRQIAWLMSLDDAHLLVAGTDPTSLGAAAQRYAALVAGARGGRPSIDLAELPFAGLAWHQDLDPPG
jgi:ribosomal protein S18 acetylase RimI-like enzyme